MFSLSGDWEVTKFQHKTNIEFWHKKIESNIDRDKTVNKHLKNEGWKVIRFWGKDITNHLEDCILEVENAIKDCKVKN